MTSVRGDNCHVRLLTVYKQVEQGDTIIVTLSVRLNGYRFPAALRSERS